MKKLLGLILTLIIIMALASCDFLNNGLPNNEAGNSNNNGDIPEFDDSEYSSEGVIYSISADNTYAEVAGYNGNAEKVKIDSEYNGLPVKNIYDSAFRGNKTITSVVIPDSVTSIGSGAFICNSLNQITVTEENAFYKSIEGNLYTKDGKKLLQYAIGKDATEFYIPDSVTSIGDYAFSVCSSITSVVIGDNVTSIGDYAFYFCSSITSVVIGDNVTSIGRDAFTYCTSLTSIVIPDSVTSIGNYAFVECSSLTSLIIPDSVTSIGGYAFDGCDSLEFNEYGNCKYLGSDNNPYFALIKASNKDMSSYEIHNDTRVIAAYAFKCCYDLTSIVIPDNVTNIGEFAFSNCDALTSVVIPGSVTNIGKNAFSVCYSLADIYYAGTEEEWSKISISEYNEELQNATIHYEYVPKE